MDRAARSLRLAGVHIPKPCAASWADMPGDERARACGACGKVVQNLSAMTEEDAASWLAGARQRGGEVCARLDSDDDGRWVFAPSRAAARLGDAPFDVPARRVLHAVGGAALLVAAAACTDGSTRASPPDASAGAFPGIAVAPATHGAARPSGAAEPASGAADAAACAATDAGATGRRGTTMGCVCAAGDPLCSCL